MGRVIASIAEPSVNFATGAFTESLAKLTKLSITLDLKTYIIYYGSLEVFKMSLWLAIDECQCRVLGQSGCGPVEPRETSRNFN